MFNPKNWPEANAPSEDEINKILNQSPVNCSDQLLRDLGLPVYFYRAYKALFQYHGLTLPSILRRELGELIRVGCEMKASEIDISPIDLLAKLEVQLRKEKKCKHACGLLQIYKVIHLSNGISETMGHIINSMVKGPRLKMGVLMMENMLRLHNLPPLESNEATMWLKRVLHFWILCNGQLSMCRGSQKRRLAKPTVLPQGNPNAKSLTSQALASRRKRQKRFASLARPMI